MENKTEMELLKQKLVALKAILDSSIDDIENVAEHTWGELRSGRIILSEAFENLETIENNHYQAFIRVKGGIAEIIAQHKNINIEIRDYDNKPGQPEFTEQEIKCVQKSDNAIDEIAMITGIISDHYTELIYGKNGGYMDTIESIVTAAKSFYQEYKNVDWEAALNDEYPKEKEAVLKGCNCWDDAVIQWAKIHFKEHIG